MKNILLLKSYFTILTEFVLTDIQKPLLEHSYIIHFWYYFKRKYFKKENNSLGKGKLVMFYFLFILKNQRPSLFKS